MSASLSGLIYLFLTLAQYTQKGNGLHNSTFHDHIACLDYLCSYFAAFNLTVTRSIDVTLYMRENIFSRVLFQRLRNLHVSPKIITVSSRKFLDWNHKSFVSKSYDSWKDSPSHDVGKQSLFIANNRVLTVDTFRSRRRHRLTARLVPANPGHSISPEDKPTSNAGYSSHLTIEPNFLHRGIVLCSRHVPGRMRRN